ncbi:Skt5p [Rhizophagus irregularis DAOM 197198w]|uniref:Skt5p n=1 Tax=Rhizophagus irregularis (strain DAOM 197198w) TaxID=1432141 RepID=A0A015KCI4_RHIIW|nr:Skt5p [Rhizophagus irregularis DAOM 197198w]
MLNVNLVIVMKKELVLKLTNLRPKAFELYKIAADKGSINAQNNLGILYFWGNKAEKDLEKAVYWLQKATENGDEVAYDNLGICYELGISVNKNETDAFELYKKSVEKGYLNAKLSLGYCYIKGIGTEIDKEKGFELYDKITEKENIEFLKSIYDNEENIISDLNLVNYLYKKSAENDNDFVLYELGNIYEIGKGVNKNLIRAFDYYKQAADKGCVNGKYKLGYYFLHGIIVDIDKEKAFMLLKESAEGGNDDAKKILAQYEQDEGIEKEIDS